MFEPVWSRLACGSYVKRTARLQGFTRRKVRGDVYPVIFHSHEAEWVDGIVYLDVSDTDFRALDLFEGEIYDRESHMVIVEDGEKTIASVYVLKDTFYHMVDDVKWDPDVFATRGLSNFLGHYKGFR